MNELIYFIDVLSDTAARLAVLIGMIGVGVLALFFAGRFGRLICEAVTTVYLSVKNKFRSARP